MSEYDFKLDSIEPFDMWQLMLQRQDKERSEFNLWGKEYVWQDSVEITSGTERDGRNEHDPVWVDIDDKHDGNWEDSVVKEAKAYAKAHPESEVVWLGGMMRYLVKHDDWEEDEPTGIYWCIEIKV